MEIASAPLNLTMAIAPSPMGVEIAANRIKFHNRPPPVY